MSAAAQAVLSEAATEVARRLGLKLGRPNLEEFADAVLELAQADRNVLVVTSDSRGSGKLVPFGRTLPEQIVEVGIAEQNLVGVAAGLAAAGKTVFAVSPACFLTARALEQIKNDVAYSDQPVILVGISAGVSYGALGSTHHSLHDYAVLRAIPNLIVAAPADARETQGAVRAAAAARRPAYLRFGKAPLYGLPDPEPFSFGRARQLRAGRDAAIFATGETVVHALLAGEHLHETRGIDCRVVSVPTVKPLDTASVLSAAAECRAVLVAEEHSVHGGLGEACAATLAAAGSGPRFAIAAIPDEETVTGSQSEIFRHYGLTMEGLARRVADLLG